MLCPHHLAGGGGVRRHSPHVPNLLEDDAVCRDKLACNVASVLKGWCLQADHHEGHRSVRGGAMVWAGCAAMVGSLSGFVFTMGDVIPGWLGRLSEIQRVQCSSHSWMAITIVQRVGNT